MEPNELKKLLEPYLQRRHVPLYAGLASLALYLLLPGLWHEIFFWLLVLFIFTWALNEISDKSKRHKRRGSIALLLLVAFVMLNILITL